LIGGLPGIPATFRHVPAKNERARHRFCARDWVFFKNGGRIFEIIPATFLHVPAKNERARHRFCAREGVFFKMAAESLRSFRQCSGTDMGTCQLH